MSSASPPHERVLVNHQFAIDGHLPSLGEVIVVRLSQDLFGPGSIIESSRNLPSRATRRNYHHAIVSGYQVVSRNVIRFTVLPMPAFSSTDPETCLSSTHWLLNQADDYRERHIPVPYEEAPTLTQPHPPFPTPARFGDPLQIGEWKNTKPSWVQAMPQVTTSKSTTTFTCYDPPVKVSEDELDRLNDYCALFPPPLTPSSNTMSQFPPGRDDAATRGADVSSAGNDTVPGSGLLPRQSGRDNNHDGAGLSASRSLALQALYENDAVKQAFANVSGPSVTLDSDPEDDDDDWEDNMDPITFARYYAAGNPLLAKIVQEHDQKMRERLNQGIANWAEGVQSETS